MPELFEWVKAGVLARSSRPGRHLGSDVEVDNEVVTAWIDMVKDRGIVSIICLLDDEQLRLYRRLPAGLLNAYAIAGFQVVNIPARDHASPPPGEGSARRSRSSIR